MNIDDKQKRSLILLAAVLLIIFGLTRLQNEGKFNLNLFKKPTPQIQNQEIRTILNEENAVISVVEKSSPSVVAVGVSQRIVNPFNPLALPQSRQSTIGTGFVVSAEKGVIVTNKHVVSDSETKYTIVTKDGKKLDVTKIYRDPNLDLALVQVSGNDLKALELGESSNLKVGQTVIAIGNALGRLSNTVTTGVVSGLGRSVSAGDPFSGQIETLDDLIQTDAAINPGNSGGPLLNSAGQVIGVNVATTEGAQNIGFAIPINKVKSIVDEFVATGKISRAFLGIRYLLVTRDVAIMNKVPQGAYVQEVVDGSPAQKAGIEPGDIITKIDGKEISSENSVSEIVQSKKVGEQVSLEYWREGNTKTVNAALSESPG